MKFQIELTDEQIDQITESRLDSLANDMEEYLHNATIVLEGDVKSYKMLVKAANYFKVPNDQRKPAKFVASKRSTGIVY